MKRDIKDYSSESFIRKTKETLDDLGFVTSEHQFAPYRDTMNIHVSEVQSNLEANGFTGNVMGGKIANNHTGTTILGNLATKQTLVAPFRHG